MGWIFFLAALVVTVLFVLLFSLRKSKEIGPHCGRCDFYEQHHGNVISQTKKAVEMADET
ncbi:MAG: hypothetical protein LBQ31_08020 [Bacteroidales bacterium]|jgi:hypothetical protein|nr:hypothetical protein [Bacteroidales bacterium]